jgi:hypothetical protein
VARNLVEAVAVNQNTWAIWSDVGVIAVFHRQALELEHQLADHVYVTLHC